MNLAVRETKHGYRTPGRAEIKQNYPLDAPVILSDLDAVRRNASLWSRFRGEHFLYEFEEPALADEISFPTILSGNERFTLSADDLESEIQLIVEARQTEDFGSGPGLYSIEVLDPVPFETSEELEEALLNVPRSTAMNARAGMLVHEDLYSLEANGSAFHDLISSFLDACDMVTLKLKRSGEQFWRSVVVTLD